MKDALRQFGLSTYEIRAFEAIIQRKSTLKELATRASIPPGKVYSVSKQLISRGIIEQTTTRPKVLYVTNVSAVMQRIIADLEHKQQQTVSVLQTLATRHDAEQGHATPFFELGTTIQDNNRIQLRSFLEAEKEVLQIINVHHKPRTNRGSKIQWEKAIAQKVAEGVQIKAIYPVGLALPPLLAQLAATNNRFTVRRLNLDYTRCDIIDGKKVLLKLVHEDPLAFGGVVFIENRAFAQNLKKVFDKFWDEAQEIR